MKQIRLWSFAMLVAIAIIGASSCSEHYDDEKYASIPPHFSDVTFTNLDGSSTITAGSRILATAVQSSYGRLLNGTTYTWTTDPSDNVQQSFKKSVIYDDETQNPTDTIVFPSAGKYTVTLTAKYKSSGNNQSYDGTEQITDGSVTYATNGLLSYSVTVEKTVVVK